MRPLLAAVTIVVDTLAGIHHHCCAVCHCAVSCCQSTFIRYPCITFAVCFGIWKVTTIEYIGLMMQPALLTLVRGHSCSQHEALQQITMRKHPGWHYPWRHCNQSLHGVGACTAHDVTLSPQHPRQLQCLNSAGWAVLFELTAMP